MFEREKLLKRWGQIPAAYRYILVGYVTVLVLIGGFLLWAQSHYLQPERTFWATVSNNLSTNGVAKTSQQDSQGANIKTLNRLTFSPSTQVHSFRKITDNSTSPASKLTLETIGTTTADFQRYSHIERTLQNGKAIDYSAVYPLWILSSTGGRAPQQLGNALLTPFLFGNLPPTERQEIIGVLKKAYEPHFVKRSSENGRRVYTYTVKLSMKPYSEAVNKYGKVLGIKQAQAINIDQDISLKLQVEIDAVSRQLVSVKNTGSVAPVESYSSYGIANWQKAPQKTSSLQDLQNAIQSATP